MKLDSLRRDLIAACVALLVATPVAARDLFTATITISGGGPSVTNRVGTNKLKNVPDFLDEATLDLLFAGVGGFDPNTQSMSAGLNLRGLPAVVSWDPAGGGTLSVAVKDVIPAGLLTFSSGSLEQDLKNLEDWFQGDFDAATAPQDLMTDILQAFVANSPVDPIAGNPNSLMSRMTGHDFMLGSEGPFIHSDKRIPDAPDQTGIGLLYGFADADGFKVDTLELPFDHRFNLRRIPNLSLLVSIPITATFTNSDLFEDGWSVMGSLGLGAQYRLTDWWALTGMGRLGVSGSLDLGAGALLYSFTANSDLHHPLLRFDDVLGGMAVHITNQVGLAQSADGIEVGDVELDYDLTNGVYRNGGYVTGVIGDSGWGWRFYGHDTRWSGDDLFVESHAELGLALLRLGEADGFPYESVSLNAGYFGNFDDYSGLMIMLRGRF